MRTSVLWRCRRAAHVYLNTPFGLIEVALRYIFFTWCILAVVTVTGEWVQGDENYSVEHVVVAMQPEKFHGWPANNGVWQWNDEILVGFTQGDFVIRDSHNIEGRESSLLARSLDGGQTWKMFDPDGYLDDDNPRFQGRNKTSLREPIDFSQTGFTLRVYGDGYHGSADPAGGFFYSVDRGNQWKGPFAFSGLEHHPELQGKILTPRTDYLIQDESTCFVFVTAQGTGGDLTRIGCIRTTDGGRTFGFVSWVTPQADVAREIMSQTVQISSREYLLASRKIYADSKKKDSIEIHRSTDNCRSWRHEGSIKVMEYHSNPPALLQLKDGRICCAYGDRHVAEIRARYSNDHGKTWGPEFIIRDDFKTMPGDPDNERGFRDMGYVRLVQRSDRKLVAIYYWATASQPQQFIAASIWKP